MSTRMITSFPKHPGSWIKEFYIIVADLFNSNLISGIQFIEACRLDAEFFSQYCETTSVEESHNIITNYGLGLWVIDAMRDAYLMFRIRPATIAEYMVYSREIRIEETLSGVRGPFRRPQARARFKYNLTEAMKSYTHETLILAENYQPALCVIRAKYNTTVRKFRRLAEYLELGVQQKREEYLVGDKAAEADASEDERMHNFPNMFHLALV